MLLYQVIFIYIWNTIQSRKQKFSTKEATQW